MVIQNSLKILKELTEIEELISSFEKSLEKNNLNINVEDVIKDIISKSER